MGKNVDAAMAELSPYKLKTKPKVCATCGQKYIPTGRGQKYCQACKARMTQEELHAKRIAKAKDAAFGPGPWSIPVNPAAGDGGYGRVYAGQGGNGLLIEEEKEERAAAQKEAPEEALPVEIPEAVMQVESPEAARTIEAPETITAEMLTGKPEGHFYYKVSIKKDEEKMLDGIIREDMLQKIMEAIR